MKKILPLIRICSVLLSCSKDKNEQSKNDDSIIIAGIVDSSNARFIALNPEIVVKSNEVGCHTFEGTDSADLNFDFKFDINLYYYLQNDLLGECCTECSYSVYFKREIEIINSSLQLTADSNNCLIPLNYGDTINNFSLWSKSSKLILFEATSPSDNGKGFWKWWSIKADKFIGMRFINLKDTIYGWIEINASETISLKEIEIKK